MFPPFVALAIRVRPGEWEYVRIYVNTVLVEGLTVSQYLGCKEEIVNGM